VFPLPPEHLSSVKKELGFLVFSPRLNFPFFRLTNKFPLDGSIMFFELWLLSSTFLTALHLSLPIFSLPWITAILPLPGFTNPSLPQRPYFILFHSLVLFSAQLFSAPPHHTLLYPHRLPFKGSDILPGLLPVLF